MSEILSDGVDHYAGAEDRSMFQLRDCEMCGNPFLPQFDKQKACESCIEKNTQTLQEEKMKTFSEKPCASCEKPFIPINGNQKRCTECQKKLAKETQKLYNQKYNAKKSGKQAVPAMPKETKKPSVAVETIVQDEIESERVLKILVAAGFVTEKKIQKAREIAKWK